MAGLANLIPLLILFIVVGGGAYIGYQIYLWSNEVTDRGKKQLEKKHMTFTKDGGLKVGVKELNDEKYADKTQSVLVNVWNAAQPGTPGASGAPGSGTSSPRGSTSRTTSYAWGQRPSGSRTTSRS